MADGGEALKLGLLGFRVCGFKVKVRFQFIRVQGGQFEFFVLNFLMI